MKKVLFLIVTLVCAVTGAWADTSTGLENGTTGSFFLYENGTPADHSLNANAGYKALIGAVTYQSGKKWTPIEKNDAGTNVQYQSDQNYITNNAQNGNPGDVVAVPNGESEYQYYIKVVVENNSKGSWEGPLSTAPEGVTSFNDIISNQVNQYQNENMNAGTYYYRVSVPLYNYYRKVRYWEPKTLTGQQNVTYYEAGTDVSTLAVPTSDDGKIAIGGDYWYVDNGRWVSTAVSDDTDYIRLKEGTTNVYDVRVTSPGKFSSLFGNLSNVPADAVFHFESGCTNILADDLALLSGNDTNGKYYIDLYDVPTSEDLENVISSAVGKMANNNNKCKGLLLPKNPTGVGTMLICNGSENVNKGKATCSEFIAYHNNGTTMAHIYFADPQNSPNPTYEQRLQKLKSIMDTHVDENGSKVIEAATSVYGISTNKYTEITDIIGIINDADATVVHTYDNELVKSLTTGHDKPSVVATLKTGGHLSEIFNKTGIQNTPNIDKLKLSGSVSAEDILVINSITTNGPDVLDLSNVTTTITSEMLARLNNPYIEYIILPAGLTKDDVCDEDIYYNTVENEGTTTKVKKMPSLKAVVSSSNTNLVAYVAEAGSLVNARLLAANATGDNPPTLGLTTVTLGGNLNNMDINSKDNGGALYGEAATIIHMDLQDAVFADNSHMNFVTAGYASNNPVLADVDLPDDETMQEIPTNCFKGVKSLREVCIPYCYKTIHRGAFELTQVNHITTTDANGALIDNGDKTYTLSAQIEQLGDPTGSDYVFPEHTGVAEVYCLATNVPKCYSRSFPHQVTYGNGGEDQRQVYCRERYINDNSGSGDLSQMIAVLRFPSFESFKNASSEDEEPTYEDYVENLKKYYTDPYREYSKKDQTGAIDADGKPLLWPTHEEMDISESSATAGNIWKDYTFNYDNKGEIKSANVSISDKHYDFTEYIGWHEFVLTQATYVKPDEHVVDDVVYNYYKDAGWYTICIPFDLSYNDVVKMLGVPKSTAKEKSYIVENGVARDAEEADDLMPDIRQLQSVERTKGEGSADNIIRFRLTPDLADKPNKTAKYLDFKEEGGKWVYTSPSAKKDGENDDPTCMVGGRPYIIKAYKRTYRQGEGETATFADETIPSQNIGLYILKHYADDFKESASCLNNDGYYEQLKKYTYKELNGDQYEVDEIADGGTTMKFAKPYENHKVQAVNGSEEDAGELTFTEGDKTKRYYYTMVGQFWDQNLPQYSVYMSKGKWYRYTDPSRDFKWAAYKCVIMATPEVDQAAIDNFTTDNLPDAEEVMDQIWTPSEENPTKPAMPQIPITSLQPGGNFRDFKNCFFPMNMPGTNDLISGPLKLAFFGRDDHDFNVPGHHQVGFPAPTRYMFVLDGDEEVVEYDENGNAVTAIATLDGEVQGTAGSSKVYNLSGQYVGNSTDGLSKGIYIVDGRKIVVD